MMRLSRRSFTAAVAVALAGRGSALSAPAPLRDVDVAVVGAGAAGIAAARRIAAAGRRTVILEASSSVGGRCITDMRLFGVPFDRGAHLIHVPDSNPVAILTEKSDLDVYRAPPGQKIRVGRRNAREGEMEDFLSLLVRATRAIGDAARAGKADISCAQALPRDLGDWRSTIEFVLGPYQCGRDLNEVSAADFSASAERDVDSLCRQGYGTMLAKLAAGVPVHLDTPATEIEWGGRSGVEVMTPRGKLAARAVIVTVSTGVLLADGIKFKPALPKRHLDAAGRLRPGSYDHIALELPGNPLGLQRDELVFEKAADGRTAALLANVSGTPLATIDVGGKFGRDLSAAGEAAMVEFGLEWLTSLFGANVKKAVARKHATRWNAEPFALGAFSVASPGGQPSRRILMEPIGNRIWLAGEAAHETLWGTVGGAWESGDRAADAVLKRFAVVDKANERQPARGSRRRDAR